MSVHTPVNGRRTITQRLGSALAYDGAVATTMLKTFQFFLVSVSFLAGIAPAIMFTVLVGWQLTHVAIWVGALATATVVPSAYAVLAAARRELMVSSALHAGREFWRSYIGAFRSLWWLTAAVPVLVVLLGYDIAIMGASDSAFLLISLIAVVAAILTVGLCVMTIDYGQMRPLELLVRTMTLMLRRPHVALSWGLLLALGAAASAIPFVGTTVMLFVPAAVGAAIVICNTALGFFPVRQERDA